jgi:hypothetical protein
MRHREFQGERRETCRLNSGLTAQPLDCPSHPLYHPESALCQWQAVPADGRVIARGIHRLPDGGAVPLRHAICQCRNPPPSQNQHLPINPRLLKPATQAFRIGRQKAADLRTPSGLNEQSKRHKYAVSLP